MIKLCADDYRKKQTIFSSPKGTSISVGLVPVGMTIEWLQ
jgi:hypothetical protein